MEPTLTVPTLMEPTLTVHTLTVPTLMVHLVAPNVLLNRFKENLKKCNCNQHLTLLRPQQKFWRGHVPPGPPPTNEAPKISHLTI